MFFPIEMVVLGCILYIYIYIYMCIYNIIYPLFFGKAVWAFPLGILTLSPPMPTCQETTLVTPSMMFAKASCNTLLSCFNKRVYWTPPLCCEGTTTVCGDVHHVDMPKNIANTILKQDVYIYIHIYIYIYTPINIYIYIYIYIGSRLGVPRSSEEPSVLMLY